MLKEKIQYYIVLNPFKFFYQLVLLLAQSKWEQKMSQIRKKSFQAGNCFILFFKWSLITINFWALKNLGGMCRNFEKRVEKNRFLQISFLEFVLQKIFKTYELILIKFCTKHFK